MPNIIGHGIIRVGTRQAKKYDELKKKYSEKSRSEIPEKQTDVKSFSDIINSLQNQIVQKQSTLEGVKSQDILADLSQKKVRLENNVISKKQHIQELKSNLQTLQKEIIHTIKEIRDETDIKINELSTTNNQLSQLTTEENELVEKIHHNQKLRVSQEKELEELRLERLNIVNKNKDTQKIQVQILQYRSRLDQITSDRAMLELEIKSQMNLLEEERQKERDIITKIIKQNKS